MLTKSIFGATAALMLGLASVANAQSSGDCEPVYTDLIVKVTGGFDIVGDVNFSCEWGHLHIDIYTTDFVILDDSADTDADPNCSNLVNSQDNYVPGSGFSSDDAAFKRGDRETDNRLHLDLPSINGVGFTIGVALDVGLFNEVSSGRPFKTATAFGTGLGGKSGHHCVQIYLLSFLPD